jgi:hypothetical protein
MKKLRILLIAWSVPYPTNVGGRQRTNLLYRALSELGDVDLISLNDPSRYSEEQLAVMRNEFGLIAMEPITLAGKQGFWRYFYRLSPKWVNRIAHNWNPARTFYQVDHELIGKLKKQLHYDQYDLIIGRYARSLAKLGLPEDGLPPVILDIDDLDTDAYVSRSIQEGQSSWARFVLRRHVKKIEIAERELLQKLQHLWVANPDNLNHEVLKEAKLLPNVPFVRDEDPVNDDVVLECNHTVMTIGSYGHAPNVRGVDWFLDEVWPLVLRKMPAARFEIYGSQMSNELKSRWGQLPGVEAIGFVEHVADAYRNCSLAVCPVLSGAGTNIKVIEAGMHRRQCVLTEAASRGFSCDPNLSSLLQVGASAPEMATLILELLNDSTENQSGADRFRDVVQEHYSYTHFAKVVKDTVTGVFSL